jgi:hypothetical protein
MTEEPISSTMKKKDRSPVKPQSSPNLRPKRRIKKQREPTIKSKKKDSPVGTPIQTPTNSPKRPTVDNSFSVLQSNSEVEEEKSVDTIIADNPDVEIDSIQSEELNPTSGNQANSPTETPEELKRQSTSSSPIAEVGFSETTLVVIIFY